jgi:hypothetical protein
MTSDLKPVGVIYIDGNGLRQGWVILQPSPPPLYRSSSRSGGKSTAGLGARLEDFLSMKNIFSVLTIHI